MPKRKQYDRMAALVHEILLNEWDPLSIRKRPQAQDEYDSYIPGLIRLLMADADKVKLTRYLHHTATVNMGAPADPGRDAAVAERLLAAWRQMLRRQEIPNAHPTTDA